MTVALFRRTISQPAPALAGWLLCLWALVAPLWATAQFPAKPNPPRLVNDFAHLLAAAEVDALERKLVSYDDSTSTQIAVVTVNSLEGYEPADYGQRLGESWGIGGKANNNGILVVVAKEERAINISTGYGMEGRITDLQAGRIIEQLIKPAFREQRYYEGLDQATTRLVELARGEYKAPPGYANRGARNGGDRIPLWLIILVVVLIFWLISRRGGRGGGGGGYRNRGGGFFPPIILGGGGGSGWGGGGGGWGGGSSGGGGFGGFGGGSFGGGGASGNW